LSEAHGALPLATQAKRRSHVEDQVKRLRTCVREMIVTKDVTIHLDQILLSWTDDEMS